MFTSTINQVLTMGQMEKVAPSIFQTQGMEKLSSKYNFIPTSEIVRQMQYVGWLPVKAVESKVRNEANQGYQKHMVRFRNFDESCSNKLAVGDTFCELVLTNSHNGLASFVFNAGLFRLACSNGMVISENNFDTVHIRHNSYDAKDVLNITSGIANKAPSILQNVTAMKEIELTKDEQGVFGMAAKTLRFDHPEEVDTDRVLRPRRMADTGNSLWQTFNRTQENLLKGGVSYSKFDENGRFMSRQSTREVKSIDGGIKLNQALWTLAEEMAKLKSAVTATNSNDTLQQ